MTNEKDSYDNNRIKNDKDLLTDERQSLKDILTGGKKNVPKEGQSRAEFELERGGRHDIEKEGTCFDAAAFRKELEGKQEKSSSSDKTETEREHD